MKKYRFVIDKAQNGYVLEVTESLEGMQVFQQEINEMFKKLNNQIDGKDPMIQAIQEGAIKAKPTGQFIFQSFNELSGFIKIHFEE